MADDIRFKQMAKRHDRADALLKEHEKAWRKINDAMKKAAIQHSQLAFAFQQANDIVKHLVLQNYLLQKRTGGVFENEELTAGQEELQTKYDERKKALKSSGIQPKQSGAVIGSGALGKPLVLRNAGDGIRGGSKDGSNGNQGDSK